MINFHELLGRRFEFADKSAPDVTLVAGDPKEKTVRLHKLGGGAETIPMTMFAKALKQGALVESDKPGFVHDGSGQRAETAHRKRAKQPREYLGDKER